MAGKLFSRTRLVWLTRLPRAPQCLTVIALATILLAGAGKVTAQTDTTASGQAAWQTASQPFTVPAGLTTVPTDFPASDVPIDFGTAANPVQNAQMQAGGADFYPANWQTDGSYAMPVDYSQPLTPYEEEAQTGSPSLSHGMNVGDGNMQLFGCPDPDNPMMGGRVSRRSGGGVLREFEAMATTSAEQLVYSGGMTIALLETEGFGIAGRALFNGIDYRSWDGEEEVGFSTDLWAGGKMGQAFGENWIKVGAFLDWQDEFAKAGPMVAALFFANEKHPITIDAAAGFGYGDPYQVPQTTEMLEVADRDYQLRAGVFLTPFLQVGGSGNFYEWDHADIDNKYGGGGFVAMYSGNLRFTLDVTGGEGGTRGYASVAYMFGCPGERTSGNCRNCQSWCLDGQSWLFEPVKRDTSLRFGSRQGPFVGNITSVDSRLYIPPRFAPAAGDTDTDGIVGPNEVFELDMCVTNGTQEVANAVQVANVVSVTGPATLLGTVIGTSLGNVAPGQTVCAGSRKDLDILVNADAQPGQTITVMYNVTADGQTKTAIVGPIVVGESYNGQTFRATLAN